MGLSCMVSEISEDEKLGLQTRSVSGSPINFYIRRFNQSAAFFSLAAYQWQFTVQIGGQSSETAHKIALK